jgi:hypothetical protein
VAQQTGLIGPPTIYRFERDGEVVDVLGPDGLKRLPPKTLGNNETIQVPAGTRALARTQAIEVEVAGGRTGVLRCPTLGAAILLKARAIRNRRRDQDRQDLIVLLSCVEDPIAVRQQLRKRERGWLRAAAGQLCIDDAALADLFGGEQLASARAAYALLAAE